MAFILGRDKNIFLLSVGRRFHSSMDCSFVSSTGSKIRWQICSWTEWTDFHISVPSWELLRRQDGIWSVLFRTSGPSSWEMCAVSVFTMETMSRITGTNRTLVTYRKMWYLIIITLKMCTTSLHIRLPTIGIFNSRWYRICLATRTKIGTIIACAIMSMVSLASIRMSLIWKISCEFHLLSFYGFVPQMVPTEPL